MYKKMFKFIVICLTLIVSTFLFSNKVEAYEFCNKKIYGTDFYDCGSQAYVYYEDIAHSSKIIAKKEDESILYAGYNDGVHIFYANGYDYLNFSYDDRTSVNNNLWTIITHRGDVVFDGSFDDSWLIDETHSGNIKDGIYYDVSTIRQFVNDGELYRTIVVKFVPVGSIAFGSAKYDGAVISSGVNEVLDNKENFAITLNSKYGIKTISVSINGEVVDASLHNNIIYISKEVMNDKLIRGEVSDIDVSVKDYFGTEHSGHYELLLLNNTASIKFDTMTSTIESSSRRIVINASAGKGKQLDTDYCWYYWSTSPDDSLVYDDFLKNYANSSYKGSYSEDKGVILRNTSGVYYLYALAKDEDSSIVVRSEGYTLNNQGYKVYYNVNDAILLVSLLIVAIIPISIYLYIRKKGY